MQVLEQNVNCSNCNCSTKTLKNVNCSNLKRLKVWNMYSSSLKKSWKVWNMYMYQLLENEMWYTYGILLSVEQLTLFVSSSWHFLCRADDIFEKSVEQLRFEQMDFEQLTLTRLSSIRIFLLFTITNTVTKTFWLQVLSIKSDLKSTRNYPTNCIKICKSYIFLLFKSNYDPLLVGFQLLAISCWKSFPEYRLLPADIV
jgi:hypothetical protein